MILLILKNTSFSNRIESRAISRFNSCIDRSVVEWTNVEEEIVGVADLGTWRDTEVVIVGG